MPFIKGHIINIGRKHSEKTKRKISFSQKGQHHSKECHFELPTSKKRKHVCC